MLRGKANSEKSPRECMGLYWSRNLLFSAKYIAMFIRSLPAADPGLMFGLQRHFSASFPGQNAEPWESAGGQGGLNLLLHLSSSALL